MKTIIFTITTILLLTSCKPECEIAYDFEIPVSVYPVNDTINIDDTLWIELNFDDMIKETSLNKDIYIGGELKKWGQEAIHIYFNKSTDTLLAIGAQGGGSFSFEMINEFGGINIQNAVITSMDFEYNNNNYHLKSGLIPKETGVYFITFGFNNPNNHNHGYEAHINYKENCDEYINTLTINVNEESNGYFNTNSHILSDNSVSLPHNSSITYSFVVK